MSRQVDPPSRRTVEASRLRPLLGLRVAFAGGVVFDAVASTVWVPRRGRLERAWARVLRGDPRVAVRLDARGVEVLSALAARGRPRVLELAEALGVRPPAREEPGPSWDPEAVSLLVFLAALVHGRVLVTEPI